MLLVDFWLSVLTITQILGHDGIMLWITVFSKISHKCLLVKIKIENVSKKLGVTLVWNL